MNDCFKVSYEVDDGYAGKSRPQTFDIDEYALEEDMSDQDLSDLFWQEVQEDFEQKCRPYSDQQEEFISWAKEVIASRIKEDEEEEDS